MPLEIWLPKDFLEHHHFRVYLHRQIVSLRANTE